MKVAPTRIADVSIVVPEIFGDRRGFFLESYHSARFAELGITAQFVQDNHSGSERGVLRGLHYQICKPQGKLVRVIAGEVFDVAVDLRRSSPTFGQWVGAMLSAANRHLLWIPPGFAHGFYVCSAAAEVEYKCTDFYAPEHERTIRWDDGDLNIDWPIPAGKEAMLSAKDAAGLPFAQADCFP